MRRRRQARERGAVAVMVALLAIPVSILTAFTMDFGVTYAKRQALASGADSAALTVINQKRQLALANPTTYPDCASLDATDDAASTAAKATAVAQINANSQYGEVVLPSQITADLHCVGDKLVVDVGVDTQVPTTMGRMVGVNSLRANREAQAVIRIGGKADCGLCILGSGDHDIQNGNVVIAGGNVAFNGNAGSGPNGEVNVTTSGGTTSIDGTWLNPTKGDWIPQPLQNQPAMEDPFAYMPMPPTMTGLTKKTNICTEGPGIYASLNPTTSPCNLSGGLYVITGPSHYSGNNNVVATNATLYFTCKDAAGMPRECTASDTGDQDQEMTGQATLSITAPSTTANWGIPKVAILADRNYHGKLSFRGNPTGAVTGTVYMLNGTIDIRGNGDTTAMTSLLIIKDLTFSGTNATLNITYDGTANPPPPPIPVRLSK